ncbi:hypothetical protein ACFC09_35905 [Streptomyces sp. NPDC056161]|uniref:hypothetical protein n=1 Tax=Streptomyces sp. NPDC056161 TaxID=3345732 RepID=UPI0035DBDFF7
MTALHSTVSCTDDLRAAAERLRDLGDKEIARSDDPLTVFRNLYATLAALRDAWPALSEAAGFEDFFSQEDITFTDDIKRGLHLAADGLWSAQDAI